MLRDCSVLIVEQSGRVMRNCTRPSGGAQVLVEAVVMFVGFRRVRLRSCELVSVVVVGTLFTTSLSAVAVLLAKTSLGPAMYCAATVYVPACSGLSGRLMDTLFEVLRDCSVLIVEPSGRVTLNCTEPSGVAPVLLVTVAVIEGVPVVGGGFGLLANDVVPCTLVTGAH